MNLRRRWLLALFAMVVAPVFASPLPGPVVSVEWLHENLNSVVVLDVRSDLDTFTSPPEYGTDPKTGAKVLESLGGHIPGARLVDFEKIRVSRIVKGKKIDKLLPSAAEFERLMRATGVNANDVLVITSQGQTVDEIDMAARLYWSLKVFGHRDMALLDGGTAAWVAAGKTVVTEMAAPFPTGDWRALERPERWLAMTDDIRPGSRSQTLIDARPLSQYLGLYYKKPAVTAPGHVEGAVNFPPDVRTRPIDGAQRFLSAAQYRDVLAEIGIEPKRGAIVYCNTGHMAAGAWFVLSEIMGIADVRLYDGSMHEWTTLGRPLVSALK